MERIEGRYMLDTCAINRICDNDEDFLTLTRSLSCNFEYYITDAQCEEIKRTISPRGNPFQNDIVEKTRAERALKLMDITLHLRPQILPRFATLFPGGWPLDGSRDILPDGEDAAWKMYLDIRGTDGFSRHENDAMIALTAIANGCSLVTNDNRLYKKVLLHFPSRSLWYPDFILKLNQDGLTTTLR